MTANTEVETPVEDKYFRMETGAQVRVPDVVEEGAEDFDGLRFTAVMSDAYRKDVGELDALSVGMFIMPAVYASKPINYDNCFGEGACYYWGDYQGATEGKKEILHVESYAYEATPGDDYLTMKASVWNMNAENLDKEFVAVAYVTDGTNYHFADPAQGAKAVSVAQKALLNPEDEIHKEEGDAALVESAYINAYLGAEGKEITYTENVYKQLKNGGYSVTPEEKTVIVKSYNTETVATAPTGYTAFTGKNEAQTIMFDGSTKVDYYYNYSANRAVLWDGDENLSFSYTDVNNYWNFAASTNQSTVGVEENGFFEGNAGRITTALDWTQGVLWQDKALPFATDTFSVIIYAEQDFTKFNLEMLSYDGGTNQGWMMPVTFKVDTYELFGEDNGYNDDGNYQTLEAGIHKFTFTVSKPIASLRCFNFYARPAGGSAVLRFDNICAESECYLVGGEVKTVHTFMDTLEVELPEVKSTFAWDGETVEAQNASIQYKAQDAQEYSDAEIVDGKATITPDASVNAYDVKITIGDIYSKEFTSRRGVVWTEFADGDVIANNAYNKTFSSTLDGYGAEIKEFAYGNDHKFYMLEGWWNTYLQKRVETDGAAYIPVAPGFTVKRIGMWIYSTKEYTIDQDSKTTQDTGAVRTFTVAFPAMNAVHAEEGMSGWGYSTCEEAKIKIGYYYYEFDIHDFTSIRGFALGGLQWSATNPLYIDNIMLLAY